MTEAILVKGDFSAVEVRATAHNFRELFPNNVTNPELSCDPDEDEDDDDDDDDDEFDDTGGDGIFDDDDDDDDDDFDDEDE